MYVILPKMSQESEYHLRFHFGLHIPGTAPLKFQKSWFSKNRNFNTNFPKTIGHDNMTIGSLDTTMCDTTQIFESCISDQWILRHGQNQSWPQIRNFWGELPACYSWGNSSEYLCRGMWSIVWGNISWDNFWNNFCRGILSIFWGRFLQMISGNIYVVEY